MILKNVDFALCRFICAALLEAFINDLFFFFSFLCFKKKQKHILPANAFPQLHVYYLSHYLKQLFILVHDS